MKQGKFITLEGGDGCGKSTQRDLTVAWLQSQGKDVVQTFEPGDTALGKEIRGLLLSGEFVPVPACELLLFLADRAQHVSQVIQPALAAGKWVVCDRYSDSTLAYQLAGRKLEDNAALRHMLSWAELGVSPDMTLWFNLSVDAAAQRVMSRQFGDQGSEQGDGQVGGGISGETSGKTSGRSDVQNGGGQAMNRLDAEKRSFHAAVYQAFQSIHAANPQRIHALDAGQTVAQVQADVRAKLMPWL